MEKSIKSLMWIILTVAAVYFFAEPILNVIGFVIEGIFNFIAMCLGFMFIIEVIKYI
ncbi:hypothetical protein [Megamonas hypermegale]|uniref:hypothetical protein n=1 Tax=Megamonas hypermegale TaxID=158847 RepID=UPI0026EFF9B1|nr:hypothetical protein [Megamonas hypermegale]